MRIAFAASVVASALCALSASAHAMGFGQVTNATRLGQPLDFAVAVRLDAEDRPLSSCASAQVSSGDNPVPPSQVHARLLGVKGSASSAVAYITTSVPMNEPVVTVTLSLGCPAKLTHKFVSLIDPLQSAPTRAIGPSVRPSAPDAGLHAAASSTSGAAAAASDTAATARQRQLDLEAQLEQQRQATLATQDALAGVQARLREAEQARRDDTSLYGLGALVILLLAIVSTLVWRLFRLQSQRAWAIEARALADQASGDLPSPAPRASARMPLYDEVTMTSMRVVDSNPPDDEAQDDLEPVASPPAAVRPRAAQLPLLASLQPSLLATTQQQTQPSLQPAAKLAPGVSIGTLVDLEQQVDFFIVLGQEDAAIELLMGHVRDSGGASPMPFLKLLEIYRRRGDADAYDRVRQHFNRRFNGHAPPWDADVRALRTLEGYPDTLSEIQSVWGTPSRAVRLLEALLFRRDASAYPFDVRAYEELLFLYGIERDVLEREVSPDGVDLLLPLGVEEGASSIVHAEVTQRLDVGVRTRSTEVDLELDIGPRVD